MAENPLFNAPKTEGSKPASPQMPPQSSGKKCGCIEKLMKMMDHCQNNDVAVTEENEDDVMRLVNFHEDLRDYASNYFDFVGTEIRLNVE